MKEQQKERDELFAAVDADDVAKTQSLMKSISMKGKSFANLEYKNDNGSNILNYALQNCKNSVAKYLLDTCSVDMLMQDIEMKVRGISTTKSNLHILTETGNIELAKLLLFRLDETPLKKKYMEKMLLTELLSQRPRDLSCLHLSAMKGNTKLVELFVRGGMSINFENNKKDTPVLWAVRYNHLDTVKYFLDHGADINQGNDKGSTPLYWAVRYGFTPLVETLVKEKRVDVNEKRLLGFHYPIILASALGHTEIVKILYENGADQYVQVNNNFNALHVAAAEGHHDIVEFLIDHAHLDVDTADINGNTALLYAAYGAKVKTMKVLVEKGANLNTKNKIGQSVWEFTLNHPNEHFLTCTIFLYKQFMKLSDPSELITFPRGNSPLHIAAFTGNVKKITSLINQGVDPNVKDINGNSFFHVAAKENQVEVLEAFIATASIYEKNNNNDTALHIAAGNGNLEATNVLLNKFKLDARNKQGMTPLHLSVHSEKANYKLVRKLVEHIVRTSTWSLVDAADNNGNTALHIACKKSYPEIIPELCALNCKKKNNDGENPFHIAAVNSNVGIFEAMLETFNKPENGVDFNETNLSGESCLHICARKSDSISLITLITNGADLSLQNSEGNTVIHVLIEESVEEPHKSAWMVEEYRNIRNLAVKWWCMHYNQQIPNEGSTLYCDIMRQAMLHLTSKLHNNGGHDSIHYAIHLKATDFLEEILNTPNVYKIQKRNYTLYDITFVMPGVSKRPKKNYVKDIEEAPLHKKSSYLNRIVLLDDITAAQMLDVLPIRAIVNNYWSNYQWIYLVLLCIHVTYMILFTLFVTPSHLDSNNDLLNISATLYKNRILSHKYREKNMRNFGWFLLWPVLILIFEIYYTIARSWYYLSNYIQYRNNLLKGNDDQSSNIFLDFLYHLLNITVTNLGNVLTLSFSIVTIIWYAMLYSNVYFHRYLIIVSLVFLFGWSHLINYTKAIESLHVFLIMFKYIILRDITRFIGLYLIVLLACGMAFNTLFQIQPDVVTGFSSLANTFYLSINAMLGLDPLFSEDFDQQYSIYGGDLLFIKVVYLLYILFATVILMNLLIAMMTDTYTSIQSNEVSTWKVGSLKLALKLEEVIPVLRKIFNAFCLKRDKLRYDDKFDRWMMSIPSYIDNKKDHIETDSFKKVARRIENKVDQLQELIEDLSDKTEILSREVQKFNPEQSNKSKSFRNLAQQLATAIENKT